MTSNYNTGATRDRFTKVFSKKTSLEKIAKEGIPPMNLVLLIWIIVVAVSAAILILIMTGKLNHALPEKSQRDDWFEVNTQILNALFTLLCLFQHPHRLYHLILIIRWKPQDISKLRKIYCKDGTYKPHEWAHILAVVLLLNLNCFAQYALCGVIVGYRRSERPAIGVGITISVAIGSSAIAALYSVISPLRKAYDYRDPDEESSDEESQRSNSDSFKRQSSNSRFSLLYPPKDKQIETSPEWNGGIFDFWQDTTLPYLLCCSFCVFGWNMERLWFGNMYVHMATFLLFCSAPFCVFKLAAINIDNESAREALWITGIVLSVFGLLYGGYWRIQMRKRFNLPPSYPCCGKPAVIDCALWLFCCWCTLAQEIRTVDAYDIVKDTVFKKRGGGSAIPLSSFTREGEPGFHSGPSSPPHNSRSPEDSDLRGDDVTLEPPIPSLMAIEKKKC